MDSFIKDFEFLPLRDVVFNTLRQEILTGKLKPGERLREIQLADKMGVSRTPVREAIRMLELEGLVKMIPRKGAEVADITEKDLLDALEVRNALEKLAIALACERISKEQIEKLRENAKEFEKAVPEHDAEKLAQIDENFHYIIFESTNNQRLVQLLNNLRQQLFRYRLEYLKDNKIHEALLKEHLSIIENIENKNVEAATNNIAAHINNQVIIVNRKN